jgi:hypothetical protein
MGTVSKHVSAGVCHTCPVMRNGQNVTRAAVTHSRKKARMKGYTGHPLTQ